MKLSQYLARLNPDRRYLVVGLVVMLSALLVPKAFSTASIGLGLAIAILGCVPRTTRVVVAASMVGIATSSNAFIAFATGVFQNPMIDEFGWTRSQFVLSLQVVAASSAFALPLSGRLVDRYGVRRIAIPSYLLFGLLLLAMSQITGRLSELYLAYILIPILGGGASTVAFARLVTVWFDKKRGLAFGAVLAGMGIGSAVLSPVTQSIISSTGWRGGFMGLAAIEMLIAAPIIFLFVKDRPADVGLAKDGEPLDATVLTASITAASVPATALPGLTASEVKRSPQFWYMVVMFFILAFAIGGVLLQLFPILTASGNSPAQAASILGALGLALIAGRALAGALMDVWPARYVAAVFLIAPILGCILFASQATGWSATLAAVLIGLASGAEVDVMAYLVSRYFGPRAFGSNYGWNYAAWSVGSGLGPQLAAMAYDRTGGYAAGLYIDAAIFGVALLMMLCLRPFPVWDKAAPNAALAT